MKWFPFSAAGAVVAEDPSFSSGGGAAIQRLDPDLAVVVVLVWLVAGAAHRLALDGAVRDRRLGLRRSPAALQPNGALGVPSRGHRTVTTTIAAATPPMNDVARSWTVFS